MNEKPMQGNQEQYAVINPNYMKAVSSNDLGGCSPDPHNENHRSLCVDKIHDVLIKQMDYGYLVKMGSQTLCVESQEHLMSFFNAYIRDHSHVRKLHAKGELDTLYEDKQPNRIKGVIDIGVIGLNLQDVRDYLADVIPLAVAKNGVKYVLETQDHTLCYHAITTLERTRRLGLDRIVETHRARDNREFEKLVEASQYCLKRKDENK